MKLKTKKIKPVLLVIEYDFLYWLFLIPYLTCMVLLLTVIAENSSVLILCKVIIYICIVGNAFLLLKKISFREFILIASLLLIFCVSAYLSGNHDILWTLLFIITGRNVDHTKTIKYLLIVYTIIMSIVILLALTDMINNMLFIDDALRYRIRYALGFGFPSISSVLYTRIVLAIIFLRKKKIRILETCVLIAIGWFLYMKTDTRTPFAIVIVSLLILWFIKLFEKKIIKSKIWRFFARYSVFIATLLSFITAYLYDINSSIWSKINIFLSGRLQFTQNGIKNQGLSILGQHTEFIGAADWHMNMDYYQSNGISYNWIDSSYVLLGITCGIIVLLIIIYMYYYAMNEAIEKEDVILQMILMIIIFHGIVEPQLFKISYTPFVLFLGSIFYPIKNVNKKHSCKLTKRISSKIRKL